MCCHLFRCFGWCLDIVQRLITFVLASILCCALCCGFMIALGAGIAYGYNFSLVEFLDLKKTDVTVYVRRGQFGDKPVFKPPFRRSGDEPELFSSNEQVDYQDRKSIDNTRPLTDAWQKAQDTSNYADKLTKYSKVKPNIMRAFSQDDDDNLHVLPLQDTTTTSEKTVSSNDQVQFVPDTDFSFDQPKMRSSLPEYRPPYSHKDNDSQETKETRRRNRKNKHKHKKPEVKVEVDEDKSLYLQPNASKFLYRREDFEDADVEIKNKPV